MLVHDRHGIEIHAEVAGQERQRQKEAGHQGELPHALVLARSNSVEDEGGKVLCSSNRHVCRS